MPVPIIAAAAAAAAARLAAKKVGQAAGKQVVKATLGKQSAAKYAAQKAAANAKTVAASSRNAKKAAETRAALKSAKSKPPLATPKSGVTVKPGRTATGPGLETRGIKPTRTQRSERAAELSFKKAEGRYEGEYLTRMTGLRGPKGVTSQSTRGQGARSLRKEAAINKEAKTKIVRINSAPKKK